MSVRIILPAIIASLIFCSCRNNTFESSEVIHIDVSAPVVVSLDDFLEESVLVPLETSDESLIGQIQTVIPARDRIYVSDGHAVFIFDRQGNFQSKIDKTGRGAGEYLGIDDVEILGTDTVAVLDAKGKKILMYDPLGTFLKDYRIDFHSFSMGILNDSLLVLDAGYLGTETTKFHLLDLNTGEIVRKFFDFPEVKLDYLHYFREIYNFTSLDGNLYFTEMMNPRIYEITPTGASEKYYLRMGNKTPEDRFFERSYSDILDFQNALESNGHLCAGGYFSEGKTRISFRYSDGKAFWWHGLYNKTNGESTLFKRVTVPGYPDREIEPVNIIPYHNGIMTVVISAGELSAKEYDNPYLFIGNLK